MGFEAFFLCLSLFELFLFWLLGGSGGFGNLGFVCWVFLVGKDVIFEQRIGVSHSSIP